MADNVMDYQTMLADMEAKRAVLDQAITSLRAAIAIGALGVTVGDVLAGTLTMTPGGTSGGRDIPKGAFHGKSMPESINLYLATVRKRCPTNEIILGLKKGGMVSTSKTFDIVVGNTLRRLKREGKLFLFDDGWGLPEWVHEGLRSRVEQKNKAQDKKRGPKKKGKIVSGNPTNTGKNSTAIGLKANIEKYFAANLGMELSGKELASKLNINGHGIGLVLAQMAKKGLLEKTLNGKFRASSKVRPISKAG